MDLSNFETEINSFKGKVESFIIAFNAHTLDFSPQEISSTSVAIKNIFDVCEACHGALSLLFCAGLINAKSSLAIELWDLTKAFEYVRRQYESRLLAQLRKEGKNVI